ncbi:ATP-binding cassette domain-containing protein [Humibacter sp. RRB41]|uniref:ATP-binding cassette domain-containing protein n=1 Tax=Humibacter sp. RRB41 TaxID=2919946 RepID=UPI001FAA19E6|nr:ATP-binding cassette domain-containing protein [Humibacter sp. RRB41]
MSARATLGTRSETTVLRARGLCVTYGRVTALQNVDLDVSAGEVVGIAGDNGAGKSTLLRCICGDIDDARGEVWLAGKRRGPRSSPVADGRVGVVWQHLELADNLDVAANLTLGKERSPLLQSESRLHDRARAKLENLGIPIPDTSRLASSLTAAERQLLALARSVTPTPRLLLLDEPTSVLSQADSVHVEQIVRRLRAEGTTILLISHDVDQLFRLTDRIVVLRHGRLVAQLDPARSHPDELLALMAGRDAASAPRQQLTRLHGLADRLVSTDRLSPAGASAGLTLILSTLGAALGAWRLSLHVLEDDVLRCVCCVGLNAALQDAWRSIPARAADMPLVAAASGGAVVVDADAIASTRLAPYASQLEDAGIASCWAVPFSGGSELRGVIGVYRAEIGVPGSDQLDLVNLYAGYAAAALERERLLSTLTARNTVLETIRAVLQTLAGPDSLTDRITAALSIVLEAVRADQVALYTCTPGEPASCRAFAARQPTGDLVTGGEVAGDQRADAAARLAAAVASARETLDEASVTRLCMTSGRGCRLFVRPAESTILVGEWRDRIVGSDERVLLEDAGHSILLAQEREDTELARHEMAALRRSQDLQRQFLARLSHELRTPLTAIHGYASSLMQTDVTWDDASQHQFLTRISSESARMHRLVDDLLDFSVIESGVLRLRPDWVDLALVIDAARSCLAPRAAAAIDIHSEGDVPVVWADHDRLEQVMMNLMDNAVRHNPPATTVRVDVRYDGRDDVIIEVTDDGVGLSGEGGRESDAPQHAWRDPGAGAGLGLAITRGIVAAHNGALWRESANPGSRYVIRLPVESRSLVLEADDA